MDRHRLVSYFKFVVCFAVAYRVCRRYSNAKSKLHCKSSYCSCICLCLLLLDFSNSSYYMLSDKTWLVEEDLASLISLVLQWLMHSLLLVLTRFGEMCFFISAFDKCSGGHALLDCCFTVFIVTKERTVSFFLQPA